MMAASSASVGSPSIASAGALSRRQRARIAAVLGLLDVQAQAGRGPLHQGEAAGHGHQEGVGARRHRDERLATGQPAVAQNGVADGRDAVGLLLPGGQHDAVAGQDRRQVIGPATVRRPWRRQSAAPAPGGRRVLPPGRRTRACLGPIRRNPPGCACRARLSHIARADGAVEPGRGAAKSADPLDVARARRMPTTLSLIICRCSSGSMRSLRSRSDQW